MMNIKYWSGITLVMALSICVVAAPVMAEKLSIGIAWIGKSGMAKRVEKGLMETLSLKAPNIEVESKKALPNLKALDKTAKRFQKEKTAMIILRSSGAKYLGKNPPSIPSFIGACNDPVLLGVISDRHAPEGKVTGVTYALPHKTQLESFKQIHPTMQSLLLLYQKNHPGSHIDRQNTRKACEKMGLKYQERGCRVLQDVLNIIKQTHNNVDAIIIGNQGMLIDNALEITTKAGMTPVFAYTRRPVYDGALAGISANDIRLGRMLGESVIDVLINGKAIRDVPIKTDDKPRIYVNIDTADRMDLQMSYDFLNTVEIVR